jgi:hypothetical protein
VRSALWTEWKSLDELYWGEVANELISAELISADMGDGRLWRVSSGSEQLKPIHRDPAVRAILWKPDGRRFGFRRALGRQVAYRSQFLDADSSAHQARARINMRL